MTRIKNAVIRLRLRVGATLIGGDWLAVMMLHILIARAARECITPEGQVILAKCQPLADVLYKQLPGEWVLNVERRFPLSPQTPPHTEGE